MSLLAGRENNSSLLQHLLSNVLVCYDSETLFLCSLLSRVEESRRVKSLTIWPTVQDSLKFLESICEWPENKWAVMLSP